MNVRIVSPRVWVIAAGIALLFPTVQLARGEVRKPQAPSSATAQPQNPFHIYSACPPALCSSNWDGLSDPASGATDFAPAGIREQFSFTTGNPVNYFCDQQLEHCHADYNSGTFTARGPEGTFTGVITSGFADQAPLGWVIAVSFSGQWSDGRHMTGTAQEHYSDEFQIPDATLTMNPAP